MKIHTSQSQVWVPRPRDEVFRFFSRAENLQVLTPPWLHFSIVSSGPIVMKTGTRIRYRIRLHGIPIPWESEITAWAPPRRFVDEQRSGPYRRWVHDHEFFEDGDGTTIRDTVQYSVFGGSVVDRFFVAPELERIFKYRQRAVLNLFRRLPDRSTPTPPGRPESREFSTGASSIYGRKDLRLPAQPNREW